MSTWIHIYIHVYDTNYTYIHSLPRMIRQRSLFFDINCKWKQGWPTNSLKIIMGGKSSTVREASLGKLLLKKARDHNLKGVKQLITKGANINFQNEVMWVHECMSAWVWYMSVWCMSVWVYECMSVWVHGMCDCMREWVYSICYCLSLFLLSLSCRFCFISVWTLCPSLCV